VRIVRLFEMNGAIGIAALGRRLDVDEIQLTNAYTRLGEALALDWAQARPTAFQARDQWERLLTAGLARDFEQLRLEFLERRRSADPGGGREMGQGAGPAHRAVPTRRRPRPPRASQVTAPMLAQIATQARVLLGR
jgi:glutamate dehydrogenase